jgi:hypothetical protein
MNRFLAICRLISPALSCGINVAQPPLSGSGFLLLYSPEILLCSSKGHDYGGIWSRNLLHDFDPA